MSLKDMAVVTVEQIVRFREKAISVERQRDELLEALIEIQQVACSGSPELDIATKAIANVEQS